MGLFTCTLWEALEAADTTFVDGYEVEQYSRVDAPDGSTLLVDLADESTLYFDPDKVLLIDEYGGGIALDMLDDDPEPGEEPIEHRLLFRRSRPLTLHDVPNAGRRPPAHLTRHPPENT